MSQSYRLKNYSRGSSADDVARGMGHSVVAQTRASYESECLCFPGGEDLFEFLDEASAGDRALAAPVVPAAVPVAAAPAIPVAIPTTLESREPPNYRAPCFFPFGKPEATAPQLKVSGVSSFKKINRFENCAAADHFSCVRAHTRFAQLPTDV